MQEEIAKDVAKALSIKLDVGDMSRAQGGTTNLEAYDKFLRALAANQKGDFKKGYQFQHEATDLDPGFLNAWIGQFAALQFVGLTFEESQKERARILERLEAVAPGSWQALFVRASMGDFSGQWLKMKDEYDAATAAAKTAKSKTGWNTIAPMMRVGAARWETSPEPRNCLSDWQMVDRRLSSALRASGCAPFSPSASTPKVWRKWINSRHCRAIARKQSRVHLRTHHGASISQECRSGDHLGPLRQDREARSRCCRKCSLGAMTLKPLYWYCSRRLTNLQVHKEYASEIIALWADYFGDKDLALAAMRRGISKTTFDQFSLTSLWYPYATGLRSDPRFKEIVRERGMVDYWRASGEWGDFCKPMGTDDFECH